MSMYPTVATNGMMSNTFSSLSAMYPVTAKERMVMMGYVIADDARPRAGPLPTAAARRRGFSGAGGSLTLGHPQVPGDNTGLGRRATRGVPAALDLGGASGGQVSSEMVAEAADVAPHSPLPATFILSAAAPHAASCATDHRRSNRGADVTSSTASARAFMTAKAATGRYPLLLPDIAASFRAAALGLPRAALATSSILTVTAWADPSGPCSAPTPPLPSAPARGRGGAVILDDFDDGSPRGANAAGIVPRTPCRRGVAASEAVLEVSSTLVSSISGAMG